MAEVDLNTLLRELTALPHECEWVEFKQNDAEPQEVGEYISAVANAAALHRKDHGYLVWRVEDSVGYRTKSRPTPR